MPDPVLFAPADQAQDWAKARAAIEAGDDTRPPLTDEAKAAWARLEPAAMALLPNAAVRSDATTFELRHDQACIELKLHAWDAVLSGWWVPSHLQYEVAEYLEQTWLQLVELVEQTTGFVGYDPERGERYLLPLVGDADAAQADVEGGASGGPVYLGHVDGPEMGEEPGVLGGAPGLGFPVAGEVVAGAGIDFSERPSDAAVPGTEEHRSLLHRFFHS